LLFRGYDGGLLIDTGLGADFPLVGWHHGAWKAQLGLEAGVFMNFDAGGTLTFDLETFDGLFGLPVDVASGPWSARLEIAHISAHYGDGVRKDGEKPTNTDAYSREFVTVLGARTLGPARLYLGGHVVTHATPVATPWMLQVGGEIAAPWRYAPFAAVDLQLAQEHDWAPAFAAEAGLYAWSGRRRLRLGVATHTGPDDTGKYDGLDETYVGVLVGFDGTGALGRAKGM